MARYKGIDTSPRFLPVDLAAQLLPGTFEHAAHHLLAHAFRNDDTGAPAYPPACSSRSSSARTPTAS
jgi:hypothetical protein